MRRPPKKPELPFFMRPMTRDQEIVVCYRAGNSQHKIAETFGLTRGRVQQILKAAGITAADNPNTPDGDRRAFIGCHVTPHMREAFEIEAKRRGRSMSGIAAELIEAFLIESRDARREKHGAKS